MKLKDSISQKRATWWQIVFFAGIPVYIFKMDIVDIFRKYKYFECFFFWKFTIFFSNCEIQILIFGVHESPMWITHQIYNICNIWCSPKKWKKFFENLPFRDDFYTYTKTLKFVVNFSPHATCIWQVHEKSKMSKNELFSLLIPIKIK